jgi:hypothetical protein
MRDESVWPLLCGLLNHDEHRVAVASFTALVKINERRANDELPALVRQQDKWPSEYFMRLLRKDG